MRLALILVASTTLMIGCADGGGRTASGRPASDGELTTVREPTVEVLDVPVATTSPTAAMDVAGSSGSTLELSPGNSLPNSLSSTLPNSPPTSAASSRSTTGPGNEEPSTGKSSADPVTPPASGGGASTGSGQVSAAGGSTTTGDSYDVAGVTDSFDVTRWPTESRQLSSPFGPRLKASSGFRYDFHRGIDIPGRRGDPIVAMADGEVWGVHHEGDADSPYRNGGNVVVIRHAADKPISFHGTRQSHYFSVYMHLDEIDPGLVAGNPVRIGAAVGTLGRSGDTDFDHLHLETRVGTPCSREFQAANPTVSCSRAFGAQALDPHVNPLLLLSHPESGPPVLAVVAGPPLSIRIRSPRGELDFNRVEVVGTDGRTRVFDLNERAGIDPANADNPSFGGFAVAPARFSIREAEYEIVISLPQTSSYSKISVSDIWGNTTVRRSG